LFRMEEKTENEPILLLSSKLDLVLKRLNEFERRLGNLEQKIGGDPTNPLQARAPVINTNHSYLKRVIKNAWSEYNRGK